MKFKRKNSTKIKCESDAWDRTEDAKFFIGLLLYRNGNLIHWRSKNQSIVPLSSTESKLEAMLEGLKEVIWISRILYEMGYTEKTARELNCDNLNAVKLTNDESFKTKSKLMNRKCYYIQKAVRNKSILVKHVSSDNITRDCLTKPLGGPTLSKHLKKVMNIID